MLLVLLDRVRSARRRAARAHRRAPGMIRALPALVPVALGLLSQTATACSCPDTTTAQRYDESAVVVLATIVDARDIRLRWPGQATARPEPSLAVTLRVVRSWKGPLEPGDTVTTYTPRGTDSCGYPAANVGQRVVIYSPVAEPIQFRLCNTSLPGHTAEHVAALDALVKERSPVRAPN